MLRTENLEEDFHSCIAHKFQTRENSSFSSIQIDRESQKSCKVEELSLVSCVQSYAPLDHIFQSMYSKDFLMWKAADCVKTKKLLTTNYSV